MITSLYANAPGLEIFPREEEQSTTLLMLPASNQIIWVSGSVLTALTAGAVSTIYHQGRNHRLNNRQSIIYFLNPELDEPLHSWVKPRGSDLEDIREHVRNAPLLTFSLLPVESL
ncbi:uncharacterized protein CC84DRAFT_310955 [Paraphaeosphaeria sporulosa]|uniref:Isopenicillin N synthase-like Fe(2+) 2OG dioxygenase domain-containing protein n=1 Tax=Paraphaeosphaeria sporulosa TaxID=1460663 RepID=A0A177C1D8_9PLEO|nr:uncharacterized protein CC84DRAFT_310955 [Paraphaeosphaeria sporulosa]OAG00537.1 hypothetical protein CC84DRAFT_310955 [Paraphaeosphaeria sporulosa]